MSRSELLGVDIEETPESYRAASIRCDALGFYDDARSMRAHARELEQARFWRSVFYGFIAVLALIAALV